MIMKELVGSVPIKPLLDREKIETSATIYAQVAPEVIRIITPKPAPRKSYRENV
mgnify:CR=1 FL=1